MTSGYGGPAGGRSYTLTVRRPYLVLSAVTVGWGTIPVIAGQADLPSPLIVAIRLWTATLCLGAVMLAGSRRDRRLGSQSEPPPLYSVHPVRAALAAALLAVHWLALFAAYKRAPAGTVILIVYLAPIGIAALAPTLLKERVGRRTTLALAAATAGFGLIAGPTARAAGLSGLLLALVAAVLFAALIMVSKPLATAYGGLRLAFIELSGAGLVLVPIALATHWPAPQVAWLWIVLLGVVHTALGIAVYLSVLAELPATHVGILGYLEPVAVVLFAWVWLGQQPTWLAALGGVLVILAGVATVFTRPSPPGRRREVDAANGRLGTTVGRGDRVGGRDEQ